MTIFMHQKVRDFYNKQVSANPDSAAILAVSNSIERSYRENEEWDHFKKIISLKKNMRILELGCGGGRWCFNIAPYVNEVYGVDISHEAITVANTTKHQRKIQNVTFLEENVLDFSSNLKFDIIYFSAILLYINDSDIQKIILKVSDMLTDNGYFIVRDTCMTKKRLFFEYPYGYQYGPCPVDYRLREEYRRFFNDFGFERKYHKVSYNKIRPNIILNMRLLKVLFDRSPKIMLKILHFFGSISLIIGFIPDAMTNQFSHEFQIYKRNSKR